MEDKELLLKDLSARLPYGVMIEVYGKSQSVTEYLHNITDEGNVEISYTTVNVKTIKPYLRPIHKLTKEELEELEFLTDSDYVDYCNKHHVDYRNLIPKGLALEAPKGMYKIIDK